MSQEHSILELCKRSYEIAAAHGFTSKEGPAPFYRDANLIQSECAEALEDFRAHRELNEVYYMYKEGGISVTVDASSTRYSEMTPETRASLKPCGIPSELADIVIRICHRCEVDNKAEELDLLFSQQLVPSNYSPSFEEMLAEVNLAVSKAYEASKPVSWGFSPVVYLSNVLAELFWFCRNNNIDLWAAIDEKEAYNRNRPFKHGGKKI